MLNRRAFLRLFSAGIAATAAVAAIPSALFRADPPTRLFDGPLTFRGIPITFNRDCTANTVYFISPETLWMNRGDGWERPFA